MEPPEFPGFPEKPKTFFVFSFIQIERDKLCVSNVKYYPKSDVKQFIETRLNQLDYVNNPEFDYVNTQKDI